MVPAPSHAVGWQRFEPTDSSVGGALFVPEGGGDGLPLVVALHGCRQTAGDFAIGTGFADLAAREGFAVLFPESVRTDAALRLNPLGCWVWWAAGNQTRGGEPGLIAGLIDRARAAVPRIGPSRACVAGLSSGAAMAAIMGAVYPDKVRAVASHAGVAFSASEVRRPTLPNWFDGATDPTAALAAFSPFNWYLLSRWAQDPVGALDARPQDDPEDAAVRIARLRQATPETDGFRVAMLIVHGDEDDTVDPGHAEHLAAQVRELAEETGDWTCDESLLDTTGIGGRGGYPVREREFRRRGGALLARLVQVERLGHAWSGGSPAGSYTDPDGPDATSLTWDFFREVPVT